MDNQTRNLKWGLVAVALAVIGYVAIPILLTMALSLVAIGMCGIALLAMWFTLPGLCEWLAQFSMWLWTSAIRSNPVARMHRDLKAQAQDIDELEKNTAKCTAGIDATQRSIEDGRKIMDPVVVARWENDLKGLIVLRDSVLQVIRDEHKQYKVFEGLIKQAEAEVAIAKSMAKTVGLLSFAKKNGINSQGSKISFDEVAKRMSESRGRMQIALNRIQTGTVENTHEIVTPAAPLGITQQAANVVDTPYRSYSAPPVAQPVYQTPPPAPASTGRKLGR